MDQIGYGILTWGREERVTGRYGSIALTHQNYFDSVTRSAILDTANLRVMEGQRVRLKVVIVEARDSGHCGDLFLEIFPSKPEIGEEIELGIGVLQLTSSGIPGGGTDIALKPEDGRDHFWMDPRKLYRVHDQTVRLYIEKTSDPCHSAPDIDYSEEEGCLSTGDGIQVRGRMPVRVKPKVVSLGDGLFAVSAPDHQPAGTPVEVLEYQDLDS